MPSECVIVPTYKRPELLFCCIKRIREIEPSILIAVFPDRATLNDPELEEVKKSFSGIQWHLVPDHDFHGNSYNTMEAFRWAYNAGYERIFYIEEDVCVHPDFFSWHRAQHEMFPKIFGSMAWIFNRHAPITDDLLFQPWYYSVGTCFMRKKLELIVQHASPRYYSDMQRYVETTFSKSQLNTPYGIVHYEQDGLIQRVLDIDRTQTVSPGITKCSHVGVGGYNRGWSAYDELFEGANTFAERVQRVEEFIADPYARAEVFGREIVEREVGHELPKRELRYRITLPGGWESDFTSEQKMRRAPRRLNSVTLNEDVVIKCML